MDKRNIINFVKRIVLFLYLVCYVCMYIGYSFVIGILHSSYSIVSILAVVLPYLILLGILWVCWRSKTIEEKTEARRRYGWAACLGLLPVVYLLIVLGIHERDSFFDQKRWVTEQEVRVYMVDDVLAKQKLQGMTREEVYQLFGKPDDTPYFKESNNIVYWLGPERGLVRIDSEWLVIWFTTEGRVERYRVMRD